MLLLAFDTATAAITVAVHDGTSVVGEASGEGAMAHGELLAPAIRDAMKAAGAQMADLTDVAVGVGPGPFTGLRVGVVTALTLGSTLGLTTHGVCSLDVIAADGGPSGEFLVTTDAKRKEVYWARYGADRLRLDGPHVATLEDLRRQHPDLEIVDRLPRAAALAELVASGRHRDLPLEPLYLRRPDAQPRASR